MDLSQILGLLGGQTGFSQRGGSSGNVNDPNQDSTSSDSTSKGENQNSGFSNNFSNNSFGANNQILSLLLPLLLSGGNNQDAIFDMLAKSNPLLGSIASVMSKSKKKSNENLHKKNNFEYIKVEDYWASH